jgi:PKD repeat protein
VKYQQANISIKIFFCLGLLFIGLMSASVTHAETYSFVTKWGSNGTGDGQFNYAKGVAVDSLGNVYVADSMNNRIQKFDNNGEFITKWGSFGDGDGQFDSPAYVAVDSLDNVYVTDLKNNRIQKFDNDGGFITKWGYFGDGNGQFNSPVGVAVDSSGNVYVVDSWNNRIQKLDNNGNFIAKFGSEGSEEGQLENPVSVAVDSSGNVYVVDNSHAYIQKFDNSGNFITKFGSEGDGEGQFDYLVGVAVDSSDNVYALECMNNYIQKFDSSGNFITKLGSYGTEDGQLWSPFGFAIDSSGNNVYVSDVSNKCIQRFALKNDSEISVLPVADFISNVTEGNAPFSVQFTDSSLNAIQWNWNFGDGTNSTESNPVHTYSTKGTYTVNLTVINANGTDSKSTKIQCSGTYAENYSCIASWNLPGNGTGKWAGYDPANGPYNSPAGVAVAPSGNIYIVDRENNSVLKLDSNGNFITRWGSYGRVATGQFYYPSGVAVDSLGNVYVTDWGNNRIQKFDGDGNFITTWGSNGDEDGNFSNGPEAIAVDSSDNIYVAGNGPDRIQKFDSNGKFLRRISVGDVETWIYRPHGIAVDANDNIYIVDGEGRCIYELNSNGEVIRTFGINGGYSHGDGQLGEPRGIAVDSFGNVYIADVFDTSGVDYGSQIQKFDNKGSFITRWGSLGNGTGQFYGTRGIAVDSSGNVYVTDYGGNRLEKFASDKLVVKPILPTANFTSNVSEGYAPLSVQFTDRSENAESFNWDFGDGENSTEQNPMHTYSSAEIYTVNLTVRNENGTAAKVATITVSEKAAPIIPIANFTTNVSEGYAPLSVQFTDASTNAESWDWSFVGDEDPESTSQNSDYTFTEAGTYNVTLTAMSPGGLIDKVTKQIIVKEAIIPVADFTYDPITGDAPLTVQFTDKSAGTATYAWVFTNTSDNSVVDTSSKPSPSVTFPNAGTYNTILKVTSATGHSASKSENIVVARAKIQPKASFEANKTFGDAPLTVAFTDKSQNATSVSWNFGDGETSSEPSSVHTFANEGTYKVTQTVTSADELTDNMTMEISVSEPIVPGIADFSFKPATSDAPINITFTDKSTGTGVSSWKWNFGDGETSDFQNPVHEFKTDGTFVVNLTITSVDGEHSKELPVTISKKQIIPVADFTFTPETGYAPLKVQFTDASTNAESLDWDFNNDGTPEATGIKNPEYTFDVAGTYTINLTAVSEDGLINITTKQIVVNESVIPVADFTYDPITGDVPLTVQFTEKSENAETFNWDFGDGANSTEHSPMHTYSTAGTYTVNLTVSNENGTASKVAAITVLEKSVQVLPVSNFTSNLSEGYAPLSVQFTDLSENAVSFNWDFGDGVNSIEQNPIYTYSAAGIYTVTLTVSNENGTASKVSTITVLEKAAPVLPVANFTSNVSEGYAPLSVQFTDLSENAESFNWEFGDGANSTEQSPMHTYSTAGIYTVNLTVSNENGTASRLAIITVKKQPVVSPIADFKSDTMTGSVPLTIQLMDISKYAAGWNWNFGDGNSSTEQNPIHTYYATGTYTVTLIVSNEAGTDTEIKTGYIIVKPVSSKLVASFYACPTSGNAPLKVVFTDSSTGSPTSWKWSFGDGTYSTQKNPVHAYSKAGKYTVSLMVKNSRGSGSVIKSSYINIVNKLKAPVAAFSAYPTSGNTPLKVTFTDKSEEKPTSWKWNFGDGTYSTQKNPVHVYSKAGKYTVSLIVKNAAGKSTVTGFGYINVAATLKTPVSAFSAYPTSGKTPLKVQFIDKSTGSPSSWKWSFGNGKYSTAKNPVNTYSKEGKYTVTLTVKNIRGSSTKTMYRYVKVSKK